MNVGWSKDITVCVKDSNRSAKDKRSVDKRQGVGVKADPCELSESCRRKGYGNPKLERWKYSLQQMGKGYFVYQPQKNKITAGNILLGKELLWRFGSKRPRRVTWPLLLVSIETDRFNRERMCRAKCGHIHGFRKFRQAKLSYTLV